MKLISFLESLLKKNRARKKICKFHTVHFQHCCSVEFEQKKLLHSKYFVNSIKSTILGKYLVLRNFC